MAPLKAGEKTWSLILIGFIQLWVPCFFFFFGDYYGFHVVRELGLP
jgi:hypothetical protein